MLKIFKVNGKTNLKKLIISLLISLGTGVLSTLLSMGAMKMYGRLKQPFFAPPSWIFGPVWTVLFILMGIASYRIWMYGTKSKGVWDALFYYGSQLVFNFLWTILFFRLELRGLALIDIIILLVTIAITAYKFYKIDKTAGYLMLPYLLWVAFASLLNYSIWQLNK